MPNKTASQTRERILDSARASYTRSDSSSPTMDDIATSAGVGRATLYRHFHSRDELLLSLLEEEARAVAERVEKRIRKIEDPASHIIEGMVEAWSEIKRNELMAGIFLSDNSAAVNRLLFNSDRLTGIGISIMLPVVERAQQNGGLRTEMDTELLIEWILRMLVSLVTVPSPTLKNKAAVRRMLSATMTPVLENAS